MRSFLNKPNCFFHPPLLLRNFRNGSFFGYIREDLPRAELASLCAKCECYVGVEGGGMDQAICLLAEKGSAKLIEFEPRLTAQTVQLPSTAVFVVANSRVEINKGNTSNYNTRVVECRLAAQVETLHFT